MSHKSFIQQLVMHNMEIALSELVEKTVHRTFCDPRIAMGQMQGDEDIIELSAVKGLDFASYNFGFTTYMSFWIPDIKDRDALRLHVEGNIDSFGDIQDVTLRVFHDGQPWATKRFEKID